MIDTLVHYRKIIVVSIDVYKVQSIPTYGV